MQQNKFEKGLIEAIKKVLSNPGIELKYQHNGGDDNFYVYTATKGNTEIFYLRIYKDQNLEIIPTRSELRINKEKQDIQPGLYKDLYKAADNEWWAREHKNAEEKKQSKDDKIERQQNQTLNFLAGFTPENSRL